MTKNEYNGWTNYETWCLKLWIDNEEGTQSHWQSEADRIYSESEADEPFTRLERATLDLSDVLKSEFEESKPELDGFWGDILNAALSEVNWHEIAENMLEDVDKDEETDDAE